MEEEGEDVFLQSPLTYSSTAKVSVCTYHTVDKVGTHAFVDSKQNLVFCLFSCKPSIPREKVNH